MESDDDDLVLAHDAKLIVHDCDRVFVQGLDHPGSVHVCFPDQRFFGLILPHNLKKIRLELAEALYLGGGALPSFFDSKYQMTLAQCDLA